MQCRIDGWLGQPGGAELRTAALQWYRALRQGRAGGAGTRLVRRQDVLLRPPLQLGQLLSKLVHPHSEDLHLWRGWDRVWTKVWAAIKCTCHYSGLNLQRARRAPSLSVCSPLHTRQDLNAYGCTAHA